MQGVCLRFYVYEAEKHQGRLLYEWLLELAKKNGIPGGSAFRSIAGYGKTKVLHEEHFFEMPANVAIQVEFILQKEQLDSFLALIKKEGVKLFYTVLEIAYDET